MKLIFLLIVHLFICIHYVNCVNCSNQLSKYLPLFTSGLGGIVWDNIYNGDKTNLSSTRDLVSNECLKSLIAINNGIRRGNSWAFTCELHILLPP